MAVSILYKCFQTRPIFKAQVSKTNSFRSFCGVERFPYGLTGAFLDIGVADSLNEFLHTMFDCMLVGFQPPYQKTSL